MKTRPADSSSRKQLMLSVKAPLGLLCLYTSSPGFRAQSLNVVK